MPTAALAAARAAAAAAAPRCRPRPPAAPGRRWLSTAAAPAEPPPSHAHQEWLSAKPFHEMPGPRKLATIGSLFISRFGNMAKKDPIELNQMVRDLYGDIVKIEGIPGRVPMVLLFNPDDIEKAFRNEGQFPMRVGNESLEYYRKHVRPEWFRGRHGLVSTQGDEWYDFRRRVNQVLMQPRSAKLYVGPIDQVAQDFVDRMAQLRDENQQMPDDFLNELCKWSLESISLVALDARLGCLRPDLPADSEPQRMIDSVKVVFDTTFKLEFTMSPWKLISTPTWRRYVKAMDFFYMLKPIAPGNLRRCLVDNLVLSGYRIPKGVDLSMGHVQLSLSDQQFPQADQFRPERWLKRPDGRSEAQAAHPFASMPFGFGPRTCIGRRFAELEVYTLVARIIRRFRVELHGDVTWRTFLVYTPTSPLKFKVVDRDR